MLSSTGVSRTYYLYLLQVDLGGYAGITRSILVLAEIEIILIQLNQTTIPA